MQKFKNLPQDRDSFIGLGCTFIGDISVDGDIRVDGTLNGKIIKAHRLIIGKDGFVNGDIHCQEAEVMGRIQGRISVSNLLHLHNQADIRGDIDAGSLRLEMDSVYNGFLRTGKAVASKKGILHEKSQEKGFAMRRMI